MPDPTGFTRYQRAMAARRPVPVRIQDWHEVTMTSQEPQIREQASRCMDCGIPFCHNGCPLGNRIPEWNDLVRTGRFAAAAEQLHATNNFPELTGRLCPAPCESACVLDIADDAVSIKNIEASIADRAFAEDGVLPQPASSPTGKSVGVVGSGPAGLAAAQQLTRVGHAVTVYERDDQPGGLLRYGIPDFKLEKHHVDRRIAQLSAEGVTFICDCEIGATISMTQLRHQHDAVLLAVGALAGRDTDVPGRELGGIHMAMPYLVGANRVVANREPTAAIDAQHKHVIIIGGGDTAADCLGVAHRQGAASVTQLDLYPQPGTVRDADRDPWPTWPTVLREYPAHEEGGTRQFATAALEFLPDDSGRVGAARISEVSVNKEDGKRTVTPIDGTIQVVPADLVLLAIGFSGTQQQPLLPQAGLASDRGQLRCGPNWQTDAPGVFVAGDAHRGASLIVWAIAEGRAAAAAVHQHLDGEYPLPAPVTADQQPISVRS